LKIFGKKRRHFFNAQKRALVRVPLLLGEDDDDAFDDVRFGRRISFSLSRGESGRYRKKTFFFFFFSWSRQENSGNSWGEKRQTTTAE